MRVAALLTLLAVPALLAQAPPAAPQLTLEQVLAKHFEAQGGLAKMKAVKSRRVVAKLVGAPVEITVTEQAKRPASFREDVLVQGQTQSSAYDGKAGWRVNPFAGYGGSKAPEPMTADELASAQDRADMDGALVDWAAKGHTVELAGTESVDGSPAYKLKVTLKSGNREEIYLDADSFLEVKELNTTKVRGQEIKQEVVMGDYKEVDGLMVPFSLEVGMPGSPQRMKVQVQKVELNIPLDDAQFAMPAADKKAEPAPAPAQATPSKG